MLALALARATLAASPAQAQPTATAPQVIAAPGSGVISLGGLAIARDGSGGLVYLANVSGVAHVFVSRLVGGVWQAPQQVDAGLSGPSSQPQITGTNNGVLSIAFINDGALFVTQATSTTAPFSAPQPLATGASNPTIQMNTFGEAYVAFSAAVPGGNDVEVYYYDTQSWAPASPVALNAAPDDAGTGPGAPSLATAGDGVAIVSWGEQGHVYSRRVWGTATSVETEQLDPSSVAGWGEATASDPAASVGGDSSYPDIAFREDVSNGSATQSRVLLGRLIAEQTQPAVPIDGISAGFGGAATTPAVAMNEYGRGFATLAAGGTNGVVATPLQTNGVPGAPEGVSSGTNLGPPYPVPALAGLISTLIAWQQTTAPGNAQIMLRYAQDGTDLGPQQTMSSAGLGPTDAADGLAAAGDVNGDAAVAWVQGTADQRSIDVAMLYQPPGAPAPSTPGTSYTTQPQAALIWSAARESWGPVTYTVVLDGSQIAQTTGTYVTPPAPLIDGPHMWLVQVTNPAGLTATSGVATVFVDTEPPRLRIRLVGTPRVGLPVDMYLAYYDPPNPTEPGAQASGIASVTVGWGRGGPVSTVTGTVAVHTFTRAGLYPLTVTATDRAGNATRIIRYLRILPGPPKAKQRSRR